jgi:hypothetical protein
MEGAWCHHLKASYHKLLTRTNVAFNSNSRRYALGIIEKTLQAHLSPRAARVISQEFLDFGVDSPDKLRRLVLGRSLSLIGTDISCLPRHPPHCRPSFHEINGITRRGEHCYLSGPTPAYPPSSSVWLSTAAWRSDVTASSSCPRFTSLATASFGRA